MKRELTFERCEDRRVMDGHLVGALADVTTALAGIDLPGERIAITASAEKNGDLLLTLKSGDRDGLASDIQLWKTDGTSDGSVKITDIISGGRLDAVGNDMVVVGDKAFFVIDRWIQNQHDRLFYPSSHLWSTDGTEEGTQFITEFSRTSDFDVDLHPAGAEVLIALTEYVFGGGSSGRLWLSDGTAVGTRHLGPEFQQDVGNALVRAVELDGRWVFGGGRLRESPNLFVPNGLYIVSPLEETVEALGFFRDFPPAAPLSGVHQPTLVGETVLFGANDGEHGFELWRTDGTVEGTRMVRDINPALPSGCCEPPGSVPRGLANVDGTLMFLATTPEFGNELWKSDGTFDGTTLVADITPGPDSTLVSFNSSGVTADGLFYFVARQGNSRHLWRSDGSAEGTILLRSFDMVDGDTILVRGFTEVNGNLFFTVQDGSPRTQVWMTDGTPDGTKLAVSVDLDPGAWLWPSPLAKRDDQLIFASASSDQEAGFQLWSIDVPDVTLRSDINGDGSVNFNDFLVLSANYGQEVDGGRADGDITGDGVVGFDDFLLLSKDFSGSSETPASSPNP